MIASTAIAVEQTKQALSPEYKNQEKRDRRNKEKLDQNQADMAESIEKNITGMTPSGDPMPKRDPNDGGKGSIIPMGTAIGIEIGIQLTNPDPSKDANEAKLEQAKTQSESPQHQNLFSRIVNWFLNDIDDEK